MKIAPPALFLLIALAGCVSQDGLQKHSAPIDPLQLKAAQSLAAFPVAPDAWPKDAWWKALGDPQLDALVAEALAASPSIRLAAARVNRAVALAEAAGAPRLPQVDFSFDSSRERLTEHGIFPPQLAGQWISQNQTRLNFSYEFDFWGRNSAALQAALGQAKAADADAHGAALVLSSAIAIAYVQLARASDQLDLARDLLAQRERQLALVHERLAAGLDSQVELKQAESAPHESRQRIAQLEETAALARNQIAALLGQGPDRGLAIERPHFNPSAGAAPSLALPSVLPADLLGRRNGPTVITGQGWNFTRSQLWASRGSTMQLFNSVAGAAPFTAGQAVLGAIDPPLASDTLAPRWDEWQGPNGPFHTGTDSLQYDGWARRGLSLRCGRQPDDGLHPRAERDLDLRERGAAAPQRPRLLVRLRRGGQPDPGRLSGSHGGVQL